MYDTLPKTHQKAHQDLDSSPPPLLHINCQDKVPDVEVLKRAGTYSVEALITATQLRWAGRVRRMADERIPKLLLYRELQQGILRKRGGQKLRFKDVLKRHLKMSGVDVAHWEKQALDLHKWRTVVRNSRTRVEESRRSDHEKVHIRINCVPDHDNFTCDSCGHRCRSKAGLLAHKRACRT